MKIRILNGGHAAIAYPAGLLDIHFVHEAMEDAQIRAFLETLTRREIQPVVPPPPNTRSRRLSRPGRAPLRQSEDRRHRSQRLCFDGSNRQPKFILPSARDRLKAGASVNGLALCRRCGAAIAMAKPRAASRSRRTTRAGSACKRRRSRRAAIQWPSSHWATSSAIWRPMPLTSAPFPMRSPRCGQGRSVDAGRLSQREGLTRRPRRRGRRIALTGTARSRHVSGSLQSQGPRRGRHRRRPGHRPCLRRGAVGGRRPRLYRRSQSQGGRGGPGGDESQGLRRRGHRDGGDRTRSRWTRPPRG